MANTITIEERGNAGNSHWIAGTLTMTDGSPGSSVATGFNFVYGALLNPKAAGSNSQYPPTNCGWNTNVNGDIKALSAGSGDTYRFMVWGS